MKILVMPSWYRGANSKDLFSGIFHDEQIRELSKYCHVAVYYLFDRTLKEDFDECYDNGIWTFRSKFQDKRRIENWFRVLKTFLRINKRFSPDIIYAHVASEVGRYAIILGKVFKIPVIIAEHSTIEYTGMDTGIGKLIGRWIYSNSCCNICVSKDLEQKLKKLFPGISFCTIYNGIIKPCITNKTDNKYRVKGKVNIALVALLYSKDIKGIQYVIPALRQLAEEGIEIILHIVGDGNYMQHFKDMACENRVSDRCIFYGYCEKQKVYSIINEMDFLLSASLVESFGCTIAEAMMLGKPVLATKSGGPESFINDRVGILIEKGSSKAIVAGIKKIISEYDKFDFRYIKAYAEEEFEMSRVCQKYIELFQEVTDSQNI